MILKIIVIIFFHSTLPLLLRCYFAEKTALTLLSNQFNDPESLICLSRWQVHFHILDYPLYVIFSNPIMTNSQQNYRQWLYHDQVLSRSFIILSYLINGNHLLMIISPLVWLGPEKKRFVTTCPTNYKSETNISAK